MTTQNLSYFSISIKTCNRCGGCGKVPNYMHVLNGTCFRCGGSGKQKAEKFDKLSEPVYRVDYKDGEDYKNKLFRSQTMAKSFLDGKIGRTTKITKYSHELVSLLITKYSDHSYFSQLIPF